MQRKYVVFWAIILLSLALLSFAFFYPRAQEAVIEEQTTAEERFAMELESRYSQIDVVNIRTFIDQNERLVLGLYFDVLSPFTGEQSDVMLLDILQGLDGLAEGTEDNYVVHYLYGSWQIGRITCPARYLPDIQSGLEVCNFEDIDPPEYGGRLIRWEGRFSQD